MDGTVDIEDLVSSETVNGSAAVEFPKLFITRQCCGAMNCRNYSPTLLAEVPPMGEKTSAHLLADSYEVGSFTGVVKQPETAEEFDMARASVAACPFGAIKLKGKWPAGVPMKPSAAAQPRLLEDNVWHLGSAHLSKRTIGAQIYFIQRDEGNILIDVPQPSEALFQWLEARGGVRWLFMTHRDHTAGHDQFAERFGCRRLLGAADVVTRGNDFMQCTSDVEVQLSSPSATADEFLSLDGTRLQSAYDDEVIILPSPGHTPGGHCLLYKHKFFFSGDHCFHLARLGHITGSRLHCWEDWERLRGSMQQLHQLAVKGELSFRWVLPGHGEWHRYDSDAACTRSLAACVAWMDGIPGGHTPLFPSFVLWSTARTSPRLMLSRMLSALGGSRVRENWLLPAESRRMLSDNDGAAANNASKRVIVIAALTLPVLVLGLAAASKAAFAMSRRMALLAGQLWGTHASSLQARIW